MNNGTSQFWREYRKNVLLIWVYFTGMFVLPISLGLICHLLWGDSKIVAFILNIMVLALFLMFLYYSYKYRFAKCPHCHQFAIKFKNLVFPIDPICPKCGQRMNLNTEE